MSATYDILAPDVWDIGGIQVNQTSWGLSVDFSGDKEDFRANYIFRKDPAIQLLSWSYNDKGELVEKKGSFTREEDLWINLGGEDPDFDLSYHRWSSVGRVFSALEEVSRRLPGHKKGKI